MLRTESRAVTALATGLLLFLGGWLAGVEQDKAPPRIHKEPFTVAGHPAFVIRPPEKKIEPIPWVLYAPTLGTNLPGKSEAWMFERFLGAGIAIAGVNVGESYGSPAGRKIYTALHEKLVKDEGFDTKVSLLARSRGGLMLYCWAAENPEKIRCITGIYPVCNLASYPGLGRACGAYGMTQGQLAEALVKHNPVDRLAPLAAAGVPIFHIHGDKDRVVPLAANSGLVAERYKAAGGLMELEVASGQGHNMWRGFFESQRLVNFLVSYAADVPYGYVGSWRGHHVGSKKIGNGSIVMVAPSWGLTAAHVATVKARAPKTRNVKVAFGRKVEVQVEQAFIAPKGDLALVRFKRALKGIQPVGVLSQVLEEKHGAITFTMAGHQGGRHHHPGRRGIGRGLKFRHYPGKDGTPGKGGDSGGAYVLDRPGNDKDVLFGIVSGGTRIGGKNYGRGIQPAAVRGWIDRTMAKSGEKVRWVPKSKVLPPSPKAKPGKGKKAG